MSDRRLKRSRVGFFILALAASTLSSHAQSKPQLPADEILRALDDRRFDNYDVRPGVRPTSWSSSKAQTAPPDEKDAAIKALGESPLAAVFEAIGPDARLFAQHNIMLSNPFMEGRVPGSRGNTVAAEYIEFYYRQLGLTPAFATSDKAADGSETSTPNASFRQPFRHGTHFKVETQAVTLHPSGKEDMKLTPGKDFTVLGMSGSGQIKGDVVFAGYGIQDGPDGYNTFGEGIDLAGKVAVVFRFEPMNDKGNSRWAEQGWSPAASLDAKIQNVAERNPAAIILVNPPGASDPRANELISLEGSRVRGSGVKMPVIMITPEAAARLVSFAGTLEAFRERFDDAGGIYKVTDTRASINISINRDPIYTDNVGAILPGKGELADQFIIVGAHYDHVGFGPTGVDARNEGKLHPGADDNASGTSGLLVLAGKMRESYAALPESASARSILFLTFSAEEAGLIGSRFFANNPSIDLAKVYIMLNMDMIGRLRSLAADPRQGGLEVQGTQSAEGLYDWLKPHFDASGIDIKHGSEVAGNSDHASFYQKQLPVLFFFTGLHRQYHQPTDTFDLINQVGAARVINLVHSVAMGLAQRAEPLKFTPRQREERAERPQSPGRVGGRVRFGIAPGNYSDDKPGVEVGDVYEGTSAADAGIKPGDRMIKWNGKDIPDVETWMPLLTSQKVGDEVDVTILREGKEIVIKVKLKGRDQGDR